MFRVVCGIHITLLGVEFPLLVGGTMRIRVVEGRREVLITLVVALNTHMRVLRLFWM